MNWMGGARNRVTFQDENKQQKDFFQRQRLRSILKKSPKKRALSNDLRALHTVSKIHSPTTIGDDSKHKHVKKIDLDRFKSCTRQIKDVDLGPVSPAEAPSKLLIMDFTGDSREEKDVYKSLPAQQKYPKHSESQANVAKEGAPKLTSADIKGIRVNSHTNKSSNRSMHAPHNKRRFSDIEKTGTHSSTTDSNKQVKGNVNDKKNYFTSTPYKVSHSSKSKRDKSSHDFDILCLDGVSPIQKIGKDNDDDGFKFKPRQMFQQERQKQSESQNHTVTTDCSPNIYARPSFILEKDHNAPHKEAIGTPRTTPCIPNVFALPTPCSQNLQYHEFKTPFKFTAKKADGHASWSFRTSEHSNSYSLESPCVNRRNSSANASHHSDNRLSLSFHKRSMKGVLSPTTDDENVMDTSTPSRHKQYNDRRNSRGQSPAVSEWNKSDFISEYQPSTRVVDKVSTIMNLYSSQTPHLGQKMDQESYCTERFSKIGTYTPWTCQPFSEARNFGSQSPKAAVDFPFKMQTPIIMASRTTDGKKSVMKTMSEYDLLEDVKSTSCLTTPPMSYAKMSNSMTDVLKEMHYLEALDSEEDNVIPADKPPETGKQDIVNQATETDEADRFLEYEDMMQEACIEHLIKEDCKQMAQLSGEDTAVLDTSADSEELISDNTLLSDNTRSWVEIGHIGVKHSRDLNDNSKYEPHPEGAIFIAKKICMEEEIPKSAIATFQDNASKSTGLNNEIRDASCILPDNVQTIKDEGESLKISQERTEDSVSEIRYCYREGNYSNQSNRVQHSPLFRTVKQPAECNYTSSNLTAGRTDKHSPVLAGIDQSFVVGCKRKNYQLHTISHDAELKYKDNRMGEAAENTGQFVKGGPCKSDLSNPADMVLSDRLRSSEECHCENSTLSSNKSEDTFLDLKLVAESEHKRCRTDRRIKADDDILSNSSSIGLQDPTVSDSELQESPYKVKPDNDQMVSTQCQVAEISTSPFQLMDSNVSPVEQIPTNGSTTSSDACSIAASTVCSYIDTSSSPITCSHMDSSTSPTQFACTNTSTSPIPGSITVTNTATSPIPCSFIETATSPIPCSLIETSTSPIPCSFIETSTSPIPCSFIEASTSPIPCFIEVSTSPIQHILSQDTSVVCSVTDRSSSTIFHSSCDASTSPIPLASVSTVPCSDLISHDCCTIKKEPSSVSCTHESVALSPMVTSKETESFTIGTQCDLSRASIDCDVYTSRHIPSLSNLAGGSVMNFAKSIKNAWKNPFLSKQYKPEQ